MGEIDKNIIDDLYKSSVFDYSIVAANLAKTKPIKAPNLYELVVPSEATLICINYVNI